MIRWILSVFLVLVSGLAFFTFNHRTEYSREGDPTGVYTAICSYRTYLSLLPMAPGSSSDKACFVKIVDSKGENYGEIPVPMIQLAALEWSANGASIEGIGEWDFIKKTCYYWSEDGGREIYVRR